MKNKPYILFLAPGFLLYSFLVIYPIFSAAHISLYSWNGIGPRTFVGIGNYLELFTNQNLLGQFLNALQNSLTIFVLTVAIIIPLQIIFAYMICNKTKGYSFLQAAIFSPQFISTPVIVFIFTLLLDGNIGFVNHIFETIGLDFLSRPWLRLPELGIYMVWIMISWAGFGVGMLFFIAAMKMISHEILEAAYLDGASYWGRLLHIIIPQIRTTILNLVLISYIVAMTIFDYSFILGGVGGGIGGSVDVVSLFFYRTAFGDNNPLGGTVAANSIGMGTTIAVVLFFLVFFVSLVQVFFMYKEED